MNKNRLLQKTGILIIVWLLLGMLLSSVVSFAREEMKEEAGETTVVDGECFVNTELIFSDNPGFFSLKLVLDFDRESFSLRSVVAEKDSNLSASLIQEGETTVVYLSSAGKDVPQSFKITLNFEIEKELPQGSYPVNVISAQAIDENYRPVKISAQNGQILLPKDIRMITLITLSAKKLQIQKNDNMQLEATFAPSDATNSKLVYTSSDPKVATVTSTGLITARASGRTEIMVSSSDGSVVAFCTVTVPELTGGEEFSIVFKSLNVGFMQTLKLFAVTLLGAIPLGLLLALGSMSGFKPLSWLIKIVVWIVRGSPLMIQLMIFFYFPGMVFGNNIWGQGETGRFVAASVAFIINYACYFSEIFRGGIQSVPKGQKEAGQVLGMTNVQIFFKITLLQMIKHIVPPISNEIITLVKDTSLARIIALQEIIWKGEAFIKGSSGISGAIWPLFFTAVYYLVFSGILTILLNRLEKKLSYFN